jgi:phosphotriesterase-related protein
MQLVEAGYAGQLLLSGDVFLKMQLVAYGGFGYAHVLDNILPRLRRMGITEQIAQDLLVGNARRLFSAAAALRSS